MDKKKKHHPITIGSLGVYVANEHCFFYAPWMRECKNTRVSVFSDVFDKAIVHIHDSVSGKFLGIAKRNRTVTPFKPQVKMVERDIQNIAAAFVNEGKPL
ncbi:MAG TPA: hypothetical protein VHO70_19890 [Chitinispirillaceae bacterium]|nr:hypothetical protein [Chitinispirillaceae bacterium]